jgi:hypothetical protein
MRQEGAGMEWRVRGERGKRGERGRGYYVGMIKIDHTEEVSVSFFKRRQSRAQLCVIKSDCSDNQIRIYI